MKNLIAITVMTTLCALNSYAFDLANLEGQFQLKAGGKKCPELIRVNAVRDEAGVVEFYSLFNLNDNAKAKAIVMRITKVDQGQFDSSGEGFESVTTITTSKNQLVLNEIGKSYLDENKKIPVPFTKYNITQTLTQFGQDLRIDQVSKSKFINSCLYGKQSD